MTDQKYWHRRAVRYERDWNKRCADTVEKRLARHYQKALTEIKGDIMQLYAMFAKDNGLDFDEARRALSGREFREWRMSMREYLAVHDAGLTQEMNTLAMRSRISRLEKLYGETLQELDRMGRKVDGDLRNFLSGAYKENYSRDIFDMVKVGGLAVDLAKVDSPSVERVLAARWSGKNYSQRIWTNTRKLSGVVRETIATSVHRGLSIPQLARRVEEQMNAGYSNAVRLVRTEMNFVNNQAHADSMEAAGIAWYEFIAVLDNRTSAPCRSRDGEAYPLEEKSVGFNYPPLHPRCRSTVAPYIDGASRTGTRVAKVGKDTIQIPASMKYGDYETVYVKKEKTLEQWKAENGVKSTNILQNSTKNDIIFKTLKEEIEPLRLKLEQQKANGASAEEMEKTVKEAGKVVVREVKGLKIYDVPANEKLNEAFLDPLYDVCNHMDHRIATMSCKAKGYAELDDIRDRMWEEFFDLVNAKPKQEYEIHKKRSEQIADILSSIRDLTTPEQAQRQFNTRSMIKPLMSEILTRYPNEWVEFSIQHGALRLRKVPKRGYHNSDQALIACTEFGFNMGIHEFGHQMENVLKGLKEMERAFYKRRTKGEKLQKMRDLCPGQGYEKDELTRKDKFLDPYMGKTYRGRNYELVSMGFEYAYTNPEYLLQDEDMAEWIYGLLAIF